MSTIAIRGRALFGALLMTAAIPFAASAQASELDVAQAQGFLGSWAVALQSDFGPLDLDMNITDSSGKVAVSVGSPAMGGMQNITNVARDGANLVLRYQIDAQGSVAPVAMTLRPNGEQLAATMSVADGMFVVTGTATKRPTE